MAQLDRAAIRAASEWFALLHGPDAAVHQQEFDAWMRSDENRRAYSLVAKTFSLGKGLVARDAVTDMVKPPAPRRRNVIASAVVLAALALFVAVFLGPWLTAQHLSSSQPDGFAHQQLATKTGEIRSLRLSDGSTVTLDTQSEVREEFSSGRRDVMLLQGRARFDVAHEGRPFVVHAGGSIVTAHGTIFDVRLDGDHVTVRLLRGAIDVVMAGHKASGVRERALVPGDVVTADLVSGINPLQHAQEPLLAQIQWPHSLLDFDHIAVRDLAREANRYSSAKLVIDDDFVGAMPVSGTFKVGDAGRLADHLAVLLDLEVERLPNGDVSLLRK